VSGDWVGMLFLPRKGLMQSAESMPNFDRARVPGGEKQPGCATNLGTRNFLSVRLPELGYTGVSCG
jgi:hypothetical protein